MNGKVFVDTNIFVYARDSSETEKQPKAQKWLESLWKNENGRLSAQVINIMSRLPKSLSLVYLNSKPDQT